MRLEKQAAMVLVGSVLRDNLDLRTTVSSVFGVIVIRDDLDFLDGVLVRRDDGCSAPGDAGSSDAVNLVVIFAGPRAVCRDLAAVLNLEYAVGAAGATNRRSRQVGGSPPEAIAPSPKAPGASCRS